jgi:hypothetical protein
MTLEQPTFPTPEDERRASLLWQTACELADNDTHPGWRARREKPAEVGVMLAAK